MSAFYWRKACAGVYYLWDGPINTPGRAWVAKVSRLDGSRYDLRTNDGSIKVIGRHIPRTAMAELEARLRQTIPDATFTRENF